MQLHNEETPTLIFPNETQSSRLNFKIVKISISTFGEFAPSEFLKSNPENITL